MTEDDAAGPAAEQSFPCVRTVKFEGVSYVLLRREDYEALRRSADGQAGASGLLPAASVGPDLRARRRRAGLTLAQVSRRAGIALETLSRIETGRTNTTLATVSSVLRALGEGGRE